jgi:CysZ protein
MSDTTLGISYLLAGFQLITKPGLRRFVLIPLIINIILFTGAFFLLRYFVSEFNIWFAEHLPAWLHWLSTVLWVIFFIGFFGIIIYTFVTVANLVSAPFNSFLAEKVEWYLTGNIPEDRSLLDNLKDIPRIIGRQLSIIAYYIPRALLILILFFIPIVQTVAGILSFLFHAWIMTLTYIDYPTDNHRIPMRDVRTWMEKRRWPSLGFGAGILVCSMIPVVNCFTIPAAVAGATKFWIEGEKS